VDDHGIAVWDWNGGNSENASPVMIEHRGDAPRDAYPIALRVMPDNRTLLVKLANGSFETWDIQNGEYLGEPAAAPSRQANFVFSEDGTMGVGISFDGILRVVDLGGGRGPVREVAIPLRPTTRENPPIALTADNRYAAVALDGGLWIVDVENQKVFQLAEEPRPQGAVLDLTFTKDGKHLVTVTAGRNVETWDVEQLVELNTN
jgi:WD40 repeat protein